MRIDVRRLPPIDCPWDDFKVPRDMQAVNALPGKRDDVVHFVLNARLSRQPSRFLIERQDV